MVIDLLDHLALGGAQISRLCPRGTRGLVEVPGELVPAVSESRDSVNRGDARREVGELHQELAEPA